jgi:hypothetical protein
MRELGVLLKRRGIKFNHLDYRIRCLPHIIDICASHIVASCTQVSEEYVNSISPRFDVTISDGDCGSSGDSGDNRDNRDDKDSVAILRRIRQDLPKSKLEGFKLDNMNVAEEGAWLLAMERNPIDRARMVVRLLCLSNQRNCFLEAIEAANKSATLPDLELLCDDETQWESTCTMIDNLVGLRPVSRWLFL